MAKSMEIKVTKDMLVGDVIGKYPAAADVMESFGLTCTGCAVNTMESIELGGKGHGMTDEQVDAMVEDVNLVVSNAKPAPAKAEGPKEPFKLSGKAAEKMSAILKETGKEGWGIRILVSPGGCAGFSYGMDFSEKLQEGDDSMEFSGVKVFIASGSRSLLAGVTVDYVETLQESGFKFSNPNAKASCGCGKSFA